jgi:hypothetical protein
LPGYLITLRKQGNQESLIKKIEYCKNEKKEKKEKYRQLKELSR